ncbi:hypothetical protein C8D90_101724 [Enterobacillus tribolii]|uniref:Uncharacterized protein n=1 Tax=Enterobacillus tribolii TaxID=1487935 RepID=A0A370R4C4_9GAMM|nr:hypothetical protein C8D90_101724 [Enterobacillus tribolii]
MPSKIKAKKSLRRQAYSVSDPYLVMTKNVSEKRT